MFPSKTPTQGERCRTVLPDSDGRTLRARNLQNKTPQGELFEQLYLKTPRKTFAEQDRKREPQEGETALALRAEAEVQCVICDRDAQNRARSRTCSGPWAPWS